jgi:hypothetical protein
LKDFSGFDEDHILLSNDWAGNLEASNKNALPRSQRCVPFSSVSIFGLSLLTCRWACLTQQSGGLHMHQNRQAALDLFNAMLSLGLGDGQLPWQANILVSLLGNVDGRAPRAARTTM